MHLHTETVQNKKRKFTFRLMRNCVLLLLVLTYSFTTVSAEGVTAEVEIQQDKIIDEISPLIYGQFIEHIENCIYNGIWSEMVLDRKFHYSVGEKGLSPWKATDKEKVTMETKITCGDDMAVSLLAGGGIRQRNITLKAQNYVGSFWAAAPSGDACVRVLLKTAKESFSVDVPVHGSELTKYSFTLHPDVSQAFSTIEFVCTSGTVILDSMSLMPADNINGIRSDTMAQLVRLNATFYRWPGGNFVSGYDWKDAVGDRDWRVSKRNLHYLGVEESFVSPEQMNQSDSRKMENLGFYGAIEPNDFGIDEFMFMCEHLNAQAMIVVNSGLGAVEDAADEVEYLNGSVDTQWGRKRADNGHEAPYGVALFEVGNEMFGDWQLGYMKISDYAPRHQEFAKAMLEKDPDIVLIGVGDNTQSWTRNLLINNVGFVDYADEHMYSQRFEGNVESHVSGVENNLKGRLLKHRSITGSDKNIRNVGFMLLEYAYLNVTTPSRLKDGLGIGVFMNTMISNADIAKGAAYSSTINAVQGCITTTDTGATMQGAGYVLSMYRREMAETAVKCKVSCDNYLNIAAAKDEATGRITLAVVNPHSEDITISCNGFENAQVVRHSVVGDSPDACCSEQYTSIWETTVENDWTSPAYSVSIFEFSSGNSDN